jgi:outer membrane receptor protein involved in Fe transport
MYVRICRAALGRILRPWLLRGSAALAAICCIGIAAAQVQLPEVAGSGLRDGDANISTVAPYAQFNAGRAREFLLPDDPKPMTVRFDVVNLFDSIYLIRDGSGIGVFAPQYGPRRGYFAGISKKF